MVKQTIARDLRIKADPFYDVKAKDEYGHCEKCGVAIWSYWKQPENKGGEYLAPYMDKCANCFFGRK